MALSNSTGLVSEAGGDTEEVVGWFSLLVRGRESLLGGSGGPVGVVAVVVAVVVVEEDWDSDGVTLISEVKAGPDSTPAAEALPEGATTEERGAFFP